MLISLNNVSKGFLDKKVLKNITLAVNDKDRIGLLGINGVGKSTLLNIISGNLECDDGTIASKPNLRIGYLKQNEALNTSNSLKEEIESSLQLVFDTRKKLEEISKKMSQATGSEYDNLSNEYEILTNIYDAADGYNAEVRINTVLNGMGFGNFDMSTSVSVLSGGEKVRCMFARMMMFGSNALILDQPTNHLDLESITAVNNGLSDFRGNVLFSSHDYELVNTVANRIIELSPDKIHDRTGTYEEYIEYKKSLEN